MNLLFELAKVVVDNLMGPARAPVNRVELPRIINNSPPYCIYCGDAIPESHIKNRHVQLEHRGHTKPMFCDYCGEPLNDMGLATHISYHCKTRR